MYALHVKMKHLTLQTKKKKRKFGRQKKMIKRKHITSQVNTNRISRVKNSYVLYSGKRWNFQKLSYMSPEMGHSEAPVTEEDKEASSLLSVALRPQKP